MKENAEILQILLNFYRELDIVFESTSNGKSSHVLPFSTQILGCKNEYLHQALINSPDHS